MQSGQSVASFPMINKMCETNGIRSIIKSEDVDLFSSFIEEFHLYYPGFEQIAVMALTRNSFRVSVEDFPNETNEDEDIQEEYLGMIHHSAVKPFFQDESLEKFWGILGTEYSKVTEKPLTSLTVLLAAYICESAF